MRLRITAAVALLVASALGGSGLIVYVIEMQRLEANTINEVDQEFQEFENLATTETWNGAVPLLSTFLARNVPDDDELLYGRVGEREFIPTPNAANDLFEQQVFLDAVEPLLDSDGSTRISTDVGEVLLSSQTVLIDGEAGALVVINFLEEDRDEIRGTMRTYAIVSTLSLFLIIAIAFWQAGRALAPLRVVRDTAEEITETDLSRRLPVTGNDDITALTRTINGMLDRLESAFLGQRQLLDDAGHELRTPLTILQGHLELLDSDDPREVAETRDLLLDEIDRMRRLVDDLILLAKTDRPGFLKLSPVDAAALTDAAAAKAAGLGERAWSVDGTAGATVSADPQRITQALLQLAHNAVKHTVPGDVVALGSALDSGSVLFWVRDTGVGVAPEDRERIFERFGRGHDTTTDGFGLGLAIVTAIARAHGGDAWLDAEYDGGARFVFSVPQAPPPPQLPRTHGSGPPDDVPTRQET
ncbi:sensor histidine kinase [Nocardioides dongxiaopingii]|uniref:sensor histidine kinase n=1 Tax=Nocardioides sp. S-1144 TaxID=2582905 RepID=UPI001C9E3761|nr:ATP-binding protein [Nocardioides sp. S-1144]